MNQVISLFDRKVVDTEAEVEVVDTGAYLKECIDELVAEESVGSFLLIVTNADNDIIIRSSDMARKEAFWLLSVAADHAKHGGTE